MTGQGWTIRPALVRDVEGVFALDRATAGAPHWPRAAYDSILLAGSGNSAIQRRMFVAASGDVLLGFGIGSLTLSPPNTRGELESLAVAQGARRAGVGRALCQAVIQWARGMDAAEIVLEVRCSSAGPISLYRLLGFESMGLRPRYYADPEDDALLMRLPLQPHGR